MPSKLSEFFRSLGQKGKAKKTQPISNEFITPNEQKEKFGPNNATEPETVSKARRRLSVDGTEVHLDGVEDTDMEVDIPCVEELKEDPFISIYSGQSRKGYVPYNPRKVNQDWMLIKEDIASGTRIFGVFDGHGEHGHFISEFICNNFYTGLIDHPLYISDLKTAATACLAEAEKGCIGNHFIKTEYSGTTAVICIIRGNSLITVNVGDSRAVMASEHDEECIVTDLTQDHKPCLPEEKERIERTGGRVFGMKYDDGFDGPARVWLKEKDIPGLAMSRSLGDTVAHSVGVISTADVIERELTSDDRVIVIGSDGLWEFMPSAEVIKVIEDCEQPLLAVERLSAISWQRWFDTENVVDDTTIIVIFLGRMNVQ